MYAIKGLMFFGHNTKLELDFLGSTMSITVHNEALYNKNSNYLKVKSTLKELYFEAVMVLTNATKHFPSIPHTASSLFHMWNFVQCPLSKNPRIWIV
jgi:hypothetical protein